MHQLLIWVLYYPSKPVDQMLAREFIRDQVAQMIQEHLRRAVERRDRLRLIHVEERPASVLERPRINRAKAYAVIAEDVFGADRLVMGLGSADGTKEIVE